MKDFSPDPILSRQCEYVDRATLRAGELGLVVPEAFVRGIRHIGYKSNVEALAELVDNSIQAYAQRIDLVLGYADGGSSAKPQQLAVIDDRHGMSPEMLRFAMMWGGTHRENDRGGLGRFGYGLPCATVSMASFSGVPKVRLPRRGGRISPLGSRLGCPEEGSAKSQSLAQSGPASRPIGPGPARRSDDCGIRLSGCRSCIRHDSTPGARAKTRTGEEAFVISRI